MATYRKTRGGEWVAYGTVDEVRVKQFVTVRRSDGGPAEMRQVERVGKPFLVDDQEMVYGYLVPMQGGLGARAGRSQVTGALPTRASRGTYSCAPCQDVEDMGDAGGCARHRGNPRN